MNKKSRILVLGASGMAGHICYLGLRKLMNVEVFGQCFGNRVFPELITTNLFDRIALEQLIIDIKPDIVINSVGALIRQSKEAPDEALFLNGYLPLFLDRLSKNYSFKIIHLSTDCVFSGKQESVYTELDVCDAVDLYGRSKILGENIDLSVHTVLRTSIIGPELKVAGEGLFHWFLGQDKEVAGYNEVYWSGITTIQLLNSIEKVIENGLTGLYHVTNGNRISKFELLQLLNSIFRGDSIIVGQNDQIRSSKWLARSEKFDFCIPEYDVMLSTMRDWMEVNSMYYNQYLNR